MSRQPVSTPSVAPPAYFLSLTVEDYRCFGPAQTLDLSDGAGRPAPWTIILGENGVGKTTLLQCLSVLRPEPGPVLGETSNSVVTYGLKHTDVQAYQHVGAFMPRKGTVSASLGYDLYLGDNLVTDTKQGMRSHFDIVLFRGGRNSSRVESNILGLLCYGYGASRRMGKSTLSEQRTGDTTASLFSDDIDLINAEEWLLQADYAASKTQGDGQAALRRDQVKQVLIELLPDITDLRIDVPQGTLGSAAIEFKTPYGWVPLNGLSLGYRTLLTWMVDLASRLFDRYPDSPNPLAEPAVVLVDEIDLHLHPRWQRTLMQFLSARFPNAQFIATAHSPLVVQAAAEDANLVLLRRDGDHVVIDNDMEAIRNLRVDQILTSELFGLDSARPPRTEDLLDEREAILSKPRLTKRDQTRLQTLEAQIGTLPTGETPQDREAMDIIRRAAELLQAK